MELRFTKDEITGLVRQIVKETVDQLGIDKEWLGGRLAFGEAELATMLGVSRHVLADHRRRIQAETGRIIGRKIGKCVHYSRDEALSIAGMGDGRASGVEDD